MSAIHSRREDLDEDIVSTSLLYKLTDHRFGGEELDHISPIACCQHFGGILASLQQKILYKIFELMRRERKNHRYLCESNFEYFKQEIF